MASLRSRIRGGHTICEVEISPAAQFLTLRLVLSVATEDICDDLDGPGHAPPYLCVSIVMPLMGRIILAVLGLFLSICLLVPAGINGAFVAAYNKMDHKNKGMKVGPESSWELALENPGRYKWNFILGGFGVVSLLAAVLLSDKKRC